MTSQTQPFAGRVLRQPQPLSLFGCGVQLVPSPMNPFAQVHLYEPSVFVQSALLLHAAVPSAHSSTSSQAWTFSFKT